MRDVWLENGVVWAAATAGLPVSASRRLTQRAIAMAGETGSSRIMLDFRDATLIGNTLALGWHADMLARLKPPGGTRVALLCWQYSDSVQLWERALRERGHKATVFTDSGAALTWLEGATLAPTVSTSAAPAAPPVEGCTDVASLKRLLERYADGLSAVPHSQIVIEFHELLDCLLENAELLGVDAMRGLEQQLRLQRRRRDQR
jgi:hypothetical protein